MLGEDVGAYVVRKPGTTLDEATLGCVLRGEARRLQAAGAVWWFVDELPRNATGKGDEAQAAGAGRGDRQWPAHRPRSTRGAPPRSVPFDRRLSGPSPPVLRRGAGRTIAGAAEEVAMRRSHMIGCVVAVAFVAVALYVFGAPAGVFATVAVCPLMMIAMLFLMATWYRGHAPKQ